MIPYIITDGVVEMMFMKPSDPKFGGPDWQIAKGGVDEGETSQEAAIREAKEELGLFIGNIVDDKVEKLMAWSGIEFFCCEVESKYMFGEPHYETGAVTWMTSDEFKQTGRLFQQPVVEHLANKLANR